MSYIFILTPIIAALFTQFIVKAIISKISGNFSWSNMLAYGGMPSTHSALVSSLATIIALNSGIQSANFAISLFFAILIMTDAIGLRGFITKQSKTINKLIIDLPDKLEYKYPVMNERVAHTIPQIIVGAFIGILSAIMLNIIL